MRKILFCSILAALALPAAAQQANKPNADEPVIVQPGAPGKATKVLPSNTTAQLAPNSKKNIEFMQGMIMHHAQAVEMTDMIASRSKNPDVIKMGLRIIQSQSQEIEFMKRWLTARGESLEMPMQKMEGMGSMSIPHHMMMPGMLSPEQMEALKGSKGEEFDRLFLVGMIQHHKGALVMVKELFDAPGAGQDADLFNFASDVDSGQRAEIDAMQRLLDTKPAIESKPTEQHNHEN